MADTNDMNTKPYEQLTLEEKRREAMRFMTPQERKAAMAEYERLDKYGSTNVANAIPLDQALKIFEHGKYVAPSNTYTGTDKKKYAPTRGKTTINYYLQAKNYAKKKQ